MHTDLLTAKVTTHRLSPYLKANKIRFLLPLVVSDQRLCVADGDSDDVGRDVTLVESPRESPVDLRAESPLRTSAASPGEWGAKQRGASGGVRPYHAAAATEAAAAAAAAPSAYRPGRLSSLEMLQRIFPLQQRTVLELVLHGCSGDLAKAIEHFLSARDSVAAAAARHQVELQQARGGASGLELGAKSVFAPPSPFAALHSAFAARAAAAAAYGSDSLLGLAHPIAAYGYPPLPTPVSAALPGYPPPLFMSPYQSYCSRFAAPDLFPVPRRPKRDVSPVTSDVETASDGGSPTPQRLVGDNTALLPSDRK